ncbi:hypothetical protein [Pelagicoccus sp. SDUM812003]|uniref:hypothetical protein n=1 Tax=Pelagicoccus sp. SDUM812003 TaxID=3041267 RepID=UPI00280D1A61|nr:hypothetical protein [Pelagicoccus sp. SDUM812003]MDQ8202699.1 hypothetical protein [Pelagicoccus sp. SDUM812003]
MKIWTLTSLLLLLQSGYTMTLSMWSLWSHEFEISGTHFAAQANFAEEHEIFSHVILVLGNSELLEQISVRINREEPIQITFEDESVEFTGKPIVLIDPNAVKKLFILFEDMSPHFPISDTEMRELLEAKAENYLKEKNSNQSAHTTPAIAPR